MSGKHIMLVLGGLRSKERWFPATINIDTSWYLSDLNAQGDGGDVLILE